MKTISTEKARILVVDDHPLFREGVMQFINRQPDLVCCAEAESSASALEAVARHKPDMVLLDLRLGHEDGLELIKALKAQSQPTPVLVVSQNDEAIYAERALRAGASGYIMKQQATDEVLTAIRTVLAGELYVSRTIALLVLRRFLERSPTAAPGQPADAMERLSDRELQVFQMIGVGLSTSQIADELHLSAKTVETYRANIKQKLNLADAPQLVCAAKVWVQGNPEPPAAPRSRPS